MAPLLADPSSQPDGKSAASRQKVTFYGDDGVVARPRVDVAVIELVVVPEDPSKVWDYFEYQTMTTGVIKHVVFGDGPTVEAMRHFFARLGKVLGSKGSERRVFYNDGRAFATLEGEHSICT